MKYRVPRQGFTVVELIVVISVVAILATMTYFILSGWRSETARTEVKHDLQNAVTEIDGYRTFNNEYPPYLSDVEYTSTETVNLSYSLRSDDTYCLIGESTVETGVQYMVDTRTGEHLEEGTCTP